MRRCSNCQRVLSPAARHCAQCAEESRVTSKHVKEATSGNGGMVVLIVICIAIFALMNS
jgi:predicted amidophosphoribosyltransferase